ncbi:MAG: hypothetical protein ACOCXH_02585 [Cyclobacteriaceae bacterium]
MKSKLNQILLVIIILLITALLAFNYGYKLGEHKGYVEALQDCVDLGPLEEQTSL